MDHLLKKDILSLRVVWIVVQAGETHAFISWAKVGRQRDLVKLVVIELGMEDAEYAEYFAILVLARSADGHALERSFRYETHYGINL